MQAHHDYIARDKKVAAAKWVRDFHRLAKSLRLLPERYEVLPEAADVDCQWRHLIFGNYRIIFLVEGNLVTILRVVHAAQLLGWLFLESVRKQAES